MAFTLLLSIFAISLVQAQSSDQMSFPTPQHGKADSVGHETFTEEIMSFMTDGLTVNFAFMQHAGIYRLSSKDKDFVRMMTAAAEAYAGNKAVTVTLDGQNIVALKVGE